MIYALKQFPDKKFTDKMDQTKFIKKHLDSLMAIKRAEYKTKSEVVIKAGLNTNTFIPDIQVNEKVNRVNQYQ